MSFDDEYEVLSPFFSMVNNSLKIISLFEGGGLIILRGGSGGTGGNGGGGGRFPPPPRCRLLPPLPVCFRFGKGGGRRGGRGGICGW